MTNKELKEIYDQVKHCKKGYCCEQMIINKGKADLIKLGENSGVYGWNWSAYLDRDTSTLYISNYRNVPSYIKEKQERRAWDNKSPANNKMKYENYISVMTTKNNKTTWLYITKIENSTKTWAAEPNKPAKKFNITLAKDLIFGLTANGVIARIEIFPNFYEIKND